MQGRNGFVKKFKNTFTKSVEDVMNQYLNEHPTYRIISMTYIYQSDVSYGIVAYIEEK